MFGWFKGLLSAPKALDVITEAVRKGVDGIGKCFFTDQEKAEFTLEAAKMWVRVQETIANENTVRSMTRRILAVLILGTFLSLLVCAGLVYPWFPLWSAFLLSLAKQLGGVAMAITAFYFGVHLLRGLKGGK